MKGLTIGEVAKESKVNVETIRYYERRGILKEPPRRPSGYREYGPETVSLIRFIKRAQDLGFTLQEIDQLIQLKGSSRRSRSEISALAEAKVQEMDKKIQHLHAMQKALGVLLDACACNGRKLECPIIEALNDDASYQREGRTHAQP